jgi:hypothetical protein
MAFKRLLRLAGGIRDRTGTIGRHRPRESLTLRRLATHRLNLRFLKLAQNSVPVDTTRVAAWRAPRSGWSLLAAGAGQAALVVSGVLVARALGLMRSVGRP